MKALPQHFIDAMDGKDRHQLGLLSTQERQRKVDAACEAEIQRCVESYLIQLGYERRTPDDICRGGPRSGWFIHLVATKRNPILLDLLVASIRVS